MVEPLPEFVPNRTYLFCARCLSWRRANPANHRAQENWP
jgi:hypothetical protein